MRIICAVCGDLEDVTLHRCWATERVGTQEDLQPPNVTEYWHETPLRRDDGERVANPPVERQPE
jgi:hypothetical protein